MILRGGKNAKSKRFNIILALIAAVALWAYVLGEINPTRAPSSEIYRNSINEEALEAEGLTIVSVSAETVNVTISGQNGDHEGGSRRFQRNG